MVDQQEPLNPRQQLIKERNERIAALMAQQKRVRVLPKNDAIRKYIKHYPSRIGFPLEGSVEWPDDDFTQRRIADGDVTIESAPPVKTTASNQGGL
jgi:hypothetical protein